MNLEHLEMIRDKIVVGLKDKKLSEQLQLDPKLTLEKAVIKARQSETVKKQQTSLQENKSEQPPVDRFSNGAGKDAKTKPKEPKKPPKPSKGTEKNPETQCSRCLSPPYPKRRCPARESKCIKCSKVGHWAKAGKPRSGKRVNEVPLPLYQKTKEESESSVISNVDEPTD